MFTAKDALYQAMAYTDKKTGGSPTPTPSNEPLIVTYYWENVEEGQGSGDRLSDVPFADIVTAVESGRQVYCVCKLFAPDAYYYLNADNNELWPISLVSRDDNGDITSISFYRILFGNGDLIVYSVGHSPSDIDPIAYQLIPEF